MEIKLQDLRRYAIEHRAEITLSGAGETCVVNILGQVRIPGENKLLNVDQLVHAATQFEFAVNGKRQKLGKKEMAAAITEMFRQKGVVVEEEEEE